CPISGRLLLPRVLPSRARVRASRCSQGRCLHFSGLSPGHVACKLPDRDHMCGRRSVQRALTAAIVAGKALGPGLPTANGLPADPAITQYVHRKWQLQPDVRNTPVRAIAQTPDGYLWLGTRTALVRFDGVRFTLFHHEQYPGLVHDYVDSLLPLPDGTLW